jgi:hypothetical protein
MKTGGAGLIRRSPGAKNSSETATTRAPSRGCARSTYRSVKPVRRPWPPARR